MSDVGPAADRIGPLDVLAFLAELGLLAGLAYAGWQLVDPWPLSLLVAVALPVAVAVIWGRWCAPRADHRLPRRHRWAVKVTLFAMALLLLLGSDPQPQLAWCAAALAVAFAVSLPADRHA